MIEVYTENQKENQKSGIITAFYCASFYRAKTLSSTDLQQVLDAIDKPEKKEMTDAEMLAAMKRFCKGFGGD